MIPQLRIHQSFFCIKKFICNDVELSLVFALTYMYISSSFDAFYSEVKRTVLKTALWNFLVKEVLGQDEAKEIGDRYEITRVVQNPDNVSLAERVLFSHNNRIVQNLTLNNTYTSTTAALAGLRGTELLICGDELFRYCLELMKEFFDVEVNDSESAIRHKRKL